MSEQILLFKKFYVVMEADDLAPSPSPAPFQANSRS